MLCLVPHKDAILFCEVILIVSYFSSIGWEQAEREVTNLKQQLDATSHKNISLEDQISHLDTALKECVRQLRQSRDEQSQKILEAISAKSQEWESHNSHLETQLNQLKLHENELQQKMTALEKDNRDLKADLITRCREVELLQVERDLSNQAAETASKQHLESTKKVVKIEAECRRLRALNARTRPTGNSTYVESVTDSQSDSGDRALCTTDSDTGGPETWASALIAELDQFKNCTAGMKTIPTSSPVEIDLMDDFLEMERLAASPDPQTSENVPTNLDQTTIGDCFEARYVKDEMEGLHAKLEKVEKEKMDLVNALEASSQLELSEAKLLEMELQLDLANEAQQVYVKEIDDLEEKRQEVELQLESALLQVRRLQLDASLLEEKIEAERLFSTEYKQKFEASKDDKEALEDQIELLEKSQFEKLGLLEKMLNEERIKSEEVSARLEAEIKSLEKSYVEKVRLLEEKMKEEKVESEEIKVKLEAQIETLEKSYLETVRSLESMKEQKVNMEEHRIRSEIAESEKEEINARLEMAMSEVATLRGKLGLLEGQIEKERLLSEEFETKCRKLEAQLERQRLSITNGDLKTKQVAFSPFKCEMTCSKDQCINHFSTAF
jgi:chromosome segregation ATPase